MNGRDQEIEAKLSAMQPTRPSQNLADQIARIIAEEETNSSAAWRIVATQPSVLWPAVAAVTVMLILLAVLWDSTPQEIPQVARSNPKIQAKLPQAVDGVLRALPTMGAYSSALRTSPERFDALLRQHVEWPTGPAMTPSVDQLTKENPS